MIKNDQTEMSKVEKYFRCYRCGECCSKLGLPWDAQNTKQITGFLNISVETLIDRYYGKFLNNGKFQLEDCKRKPCPFLGENENGEGRCLIYEVRPKDCVSFPTKPFRYDFIKCPAVEAIVKKLKSE